MEMKQVGFLFFGLKKKSAGQMITGNEMDPGLISYNYHDINDWFKQYYSNLYQSEVQGNVSETDLFLNSLDIQKSL